MTDQQTYTTNWGAALLSLSRSIPTYGDGNLAVKLLPIISESVVIPTARLLAMIDRLDPDAMRSYLRERSDYLDSPEDTDTPDPVEQMRESGRQLGEAWRALSDAFREASKGSNR